MPGLNEWLHEINNMKWREKTRKKKQNVVVNFRSFSVSNVFKYAWIYWNNNIHTFALFGLCIHRMLFLCVFGKLEIANEIINVFLWTMFGVGCFFFFSCVLGDGEEGEINYNQISKIWNNTTNVHDVDMRVRFGCFFRSANVSMTMDGIFEQLKCYHWILLGSYLYT